LCDNDYRSQFLVRMSSSFAARTSVEVVEEGMLLAPKFDANGLIPVVTTDAITGEVLMHAYMNEAALLKTLETGEAHYYSRSRQQIWHKGATSGLVQTVQQLLIDDDQDCLWMKVKVAGSGASCHVGYRSCFYRQICPSKGDEAVSHPFTLTFTEATKTFDPIAVYGDAPNPTQL
jgi:phosphoribosyl-AMP cyclohydrolase